MVGGFSGKRSVHVTQSSGVSNFDFQPPLTVAQFADMPLPSLQDRPYDAQHQSSIDIADDRITRVSFFNSKYELEYENLHLYIKHLIQYLGDEAVSLALSTHYKAK